MKIWHQEERSLSIDENDAAMVIWRLAIDVRV